MSMHSMVCCLLLSACASANRVETCQDNEVSVSKHTSSSDFSDATLGMQTTGQKCCCKTHQRGCTWEYLYCDLQKSNFNKPCHEKFHVEVQAQARAADKRMVFREFSTFAKDDLVVGDGALWAKYNHEMHKLLDEMTNAVLSELEQAIEMVPRNTDQDFSLQQMFQKEEAFNKISDSASELDTLIQVAEAGNVTDNNLSLEVLGQVELHRNAFKLRVDEHCHAHKQEEESRVACNERDDKAYCEKTYRAVGARPLDIVYDPRCSKWVTEDDRKWAAIHAANKRLLAPGSDIIVED